MERLRMVGGGGTAVTSCPFPVGFGGFFKDDPNSIYAGTTWEQKKDVFILAAGDTYASGSTGGEAQHILTESELPQISGGLTLHGQDKATNVAKTRGHVTGTIIKNKFMSIQNIFDGADSVAGVQFAFGGDQPHNNMPPYFAMPFWIRTA